MDRRIFGIETEYGVTCTFRGQRRLSPDEVARYLFRRVVAWGRSSNVFLRNGSRLYLDVGSHPEYATAECDSVQQLITHDRAGERILEGLCVDAEQRLREEGIAGDIYLFKNNTDSAGNSYGCHENFLVDRSTDFLALAEGFIPFLISRQIITGAGKVLNTPRGARYCVSQRADHIWEGVSSAPTRSRPIINTRDEPHCDPERYRRLHVIVGDANMSEVATFLKLATTAIVLSMIEDGVMPSHLELESPVEDVRRISHDPSLTATVALVGGRRVRALEVQWDLLAAAREWAQRYGLESVGGDAVGSLALDEWERVLHGLETDPDSVADTVDWVAKQRLVTAYAQRHGLEPRHPRLRAIDLQYHDLRPDRGLAARAGLRRLTEDSQVAAAMHEPPDSTRAYFRGRCLSRFADAIVAANWDSMVFDVGAGPLRRVPMNEPLRGTASLVGNVIDSSETAGDLLRRIAG